MNVRQLVTLLGVAAAAVVACADPVEREQNLWPFVVWDQEPATHQEAWTAAGPFLFYKPAPDAAGNSVSGLRPLWVQEKNSQGELRAGYFLYPLFSYTVDDDSRRWSLLELVRWWERRPAAGTPDSRSDQRGQFDIFPFWFSRQTGDPETSYRALFPIYGTLKGRLGFQRVSWTLFPFYVENEKRGAVTTSTPWPIIRVTRGAAHGWGVWPLFNYVERPGVSRYETYLWPLGYNVTVWPSPDDPPGTPPRRDIGALPFYARSTGAGYINEDFLWPFFGYTEKTKPTRYSEQRYLWPLFVQGRGDNRYVNRWAPFYTHSNIKGYDKHWYLWPLVRRAEWNEKGVERTRTQLAYFFYWDEEQRIAGRANSPTATLTHVWPLYSNWDDGAGRRQWQVFSPLEVFFSGNEKVRQVWSPLFAIARHESRGPGDSRTSLLWNAISWEQHRNEERSEFHLGPILGVTHQGDDQRIAIGNGLFGLRRAPGSGWRMFWLDFPSKSATNSSASR